MDTPLPRKPMTMAEMMPGISAILTKEARQAYTGVKQPRATVATTLTVEKTYKPMTMAEMKANFKVLKVPTPKKTMQQQTSTKKKWNSSAKVKKTVSLTANSQPKNIVRKVLNFQQPKPRIPDVSLAALPHRMPMLIHRAKKDQHFGHVSQQTASNSRVTLNPSTPKFLRPEIKAKRSLLLPAESKATNILSISGICHIEETPLLVNKPAAKSRMTIANKENISRVKLTATTPKSSLLKRVMLSRIPDTPLSNESWKSSCDDSFIQNEKDVELIENKSKALTKPNTFQELVKVSPPASTPFKDYRNVNEYFNDSINDNSSVAQDNTIMSFDTTSVSNENNKREESVIVSLCDMLSKTKVAKTNTEKVSTDLEDFLEVQKQTANNIVMIENGIKILNSIKESELKSLKRLEKLINEKQKQTSECEEKTIIETTKEIPIQDLTPIKSQVARPCSVIKSCLKSPSYKIPKKMSCVKKKVHYRSLPNVSDLKSTPEKDMGGRALSMYLKMKEHMNFLNTPAGKQRPSDIVMDTPRIASQNLQKQLDKLYNEN